MMVVDIVKHSGMKEVAKMSIAKAMESEDVPSAHLQMTSNDNSWR
jgi:hypothetical protein